VIGILGGSFNPAHDGHLHISEASLRHLRLDELWWLVSPQNPLKPAHTMASQAERIAAAANLADHPNIKVTGMEAAWGTSYTADSLRVLLRRFPKSRFIWVMGADNLQQISHWDRWPRIFRSVAVAVFDRSPYSREAMASKAAWRFSRWRVASAGRLALKPPPAWIFMHIKRHPASATAIRRRLAGLTQE
jgi:nicotinate-nucleotide adenylyltransferase